MQPAVMSVRAALLIDADNFHHPDQLLAVQAQFAQHMGQHFICHAHGSAQVLAREVLKPVWQALAARLMPALPLPKNTVDTSLVMDALLLHFQHGVTRFGIASGDADFAPLSLQLRELGCEVWCFARAAIAFEHMPSYYDRVVRFDNPPPDSATPPPTPKPAPKPPSQAKSPAPSPAAKPISLERVLQALPALAQGTPQHLNQTVNTLRQKGLMGKNAKAVTWFAQFGGAFKVVSAPGVTATVCWQSKPQAKTQKSPAVAAKKAPTLQALPTPPASAPTAPLTWPALKPRRNAQILQSLELHALRKALLQLAGSRITVEQVLLAVPELATGQACVLGGVASRLREHGLLHDSRSAMDVLAVHPEFEVHLKAFPQTVRYRPLDEPSLTAAHPPAPPGQTADSAPPAR